MDVGAYLNRIGYRGPVEPRAELLHRLHRAHLRAVPFENLDIHLGRRIRLDEVKLFEKVIGQRRGGYCYELNGLFAVLLNRLGFRVTMLSADIPAEQGGCGFGFDHLILLVELEARWIVDVGFGDAYRVPLNLDDRDEQPGSVASKYRVPERQGRWLVEAADDAGVWSVDYVFDLAPRQLSDFQPACDYYELNPASGFRRKRITSRATRDGHVSLTNDRLIFTTDGTRREVPLASETDYLKSLKEHFGIALEREKWSIAWLFPSQTGAHSGV